MKKCSNCGFHNTDERHRCLKCGAILEHAWEAVGDEVKLRRFPVHRLTAAFGNTWRFVRRQLTFPLPEECPYRHPWTAGFLSFLPGLGQLYNHQYKKAYLFLVVLPLFPWLIAATILSWTSYLVIAALIVWIALSFNDALITATRINGQEWTYGYRVAMFCALFFYLGVFWSLSQFFLVGLFMGFVAYCLSVVFSVRDQVSRWRILVPVAVAAAILVVACVLARSGNPVIHRWIRWSQDVLAPTLRSGDYIYVDCLTYWFRKPRVGDLVYYNPRTYTIKRGEDDTFIINMRNAIERVVAFAGDEFVRDGDKFYRNGKPVPTHERPVQTAGLPGGFTFKVPAGHYLILIGYGPEGSMIDARGRAPSPREGVSPDWGKACLVTRDEIFGRCLFLWHPPGRRRWLTAQKGLEE